MALKDFHLKQKALQLKRFLMGSAGRKKREVTNAKKPSWMMPAVSHGYYTIEAFKSPSGYEDSDSDFVVVQREQIEELELWFFGVFDARIGDGLPMFFFSSSELRFFMSHSVQSHVRAKSKETMRKAYLGARAKTRESTEETHGVGSVSAMVIDGEKLVLANMGDYRAVVCRDGLAHQIGSRNNQSGKRHWSQRFFKGNAASTRQSKTSDLVVGAERVDPDTEFVILASTGIWEVMKNQEAVNLIKHIENPQAASECLAKEASNRMSRGSISCLVIRFD
ncbi:putative protein phosphatase 2C-like protein 44 [Prunus yedoensis var. nudiflora]|uniref:PPM-type phosphatase domain-containing protein n=1 Tax=Prunus yedoensis var. nudiflora TaxID=2094558 RepID=A0A314ZF74_PRUYE|nr:putative protein phosphatase 2C-like protein 44 [Prunus yedoensis var. nudiflora]